MPAASPRIHEAPDDLLAAIDYCYEQGWTDGLPVVPPQVDRVHAMLAADDRPAETVIAKHPATGLELSLHAAAVNAVMAGCLPAYFPVLVAAFEAMDRPDFNFHGSTASTGGSAPLLVVSGPLADDIGMNADVNLFGPGNRPNATIGRAVRLILRNVFQMLPGISDKSTQGNPGKYSLCIAERMRGNPWPPLCQEQGYPAGTSSVTVYAAGGFCNVENHGGNTPEQVLGSVADAMANYGCITLGQSVVILAPEHMQIVADAGWTRKTGAGLPVHRGQALGRGHEGRRQVPRPRVRHPARRGRPCARRARASCIAALRPDDILVTLGGGDAGGHSCFLPSWSRGRGSIMQHAAIRPLAREAKRRTVRCSSTLPPRPRPRASARARPPSPSSTARASASWRTASSTPRRC